ncbi:hypothetical protein [Paraburkholderia silvatlantica]
MSAADRDAALDHTVESLQVRFGMRHVTLQVDPGTSDSDRV